MGVSPKTDGQAEAVAVRTFLIADIRGYTTFTRQRGDADAARLAGRFADLARDAVEARNGLVLELREDEALAAFNPRTGVLASTGCDGTTTLTDPETGQVIGSPLPGTSEVWTTLAWDRTGDRLAVMDASGVGYLWDMAATDWEAFACNTAGRTLTRDVWRQYLPDRPYEPACSS